MREIKVDEVSFNVDHWSTRPLDEFIEFGLQFWPGLGEDEKRERLTRVWPYIKPDNEPDGNETQTEPAEPAAGD